MSVANNVGGILTYPVPTEEASVQSGRFIDDDHWRKVADIFPLEKINPIDYGDGIQLDDSSEKFEVKVGNGRSYEPSLKQEGFTLATKVPTAVSDFADVDEVKRVYIDQEVQSIVISAFEASSVKPPITVIPFHWLVRDSRRSNYDSSQGPATFKGNSHAPVSRVHGDYTVENAPLRFEELKAKGLLPKTWDKDKAHWGIVNVWRNVADEPIKCKPLAVLDTTSLSREDIFQYWLVKKDKVHIGRNLAISYDPNHRWFYFPEMTNTEALVFFTYETNNEESVHPRWVFHTAFDPFQTMMAEKMGEEKTDASACRTSIETRCLVVFDSKE